MSSASFPLLTKNRTATAAIEPYRIVKLGANDGEVTQSSAATDVHLGVSGVARADAGERIDIEHVGIVPVTYGADGITPGTRLTSNADGKAVAAIATNNVIGYAMETGDTDEVGSMLIAPQLF